MSNYYKVGIIGDGTEDNPFRPDVPEDVEWVGNTDYNDGFLIKTSKNINGHTPLAENEVRAVATQMKFDVNEVLNNWLPERIPDVVPVDPPVPPTPPIPDRNPNN